MLKDILVAAGAVSLIAALVFALRGDYGGAIWLCLNGIILSAGVLYERWRYKKPDELGPGAAGWQRTGERFIDPHSGRLTDVYYNAQTGERRYVSRR